MNIGDIVICIDTTKLKYSSLIINNKYQIIDIDDNIDILIKIINEYNEPAWFYKNRFITLKNQRKLKLENIENATR